MTQPTPLAQDQAGEGWREEEAAANSHGTQAMSGVVDAFCSYMAEEGGYNPEFPIMVSAGLAIKRSGVHTNDDALTEIAMRSSLSGRSCDAGCNTTPLQCATSIADATKCCA
jgi:hypothetical protein